MKINIAVKTNGQRKSLGFTLIEMIGVLAVIAILAALLVPKVTSAISDAKVNNAISTYQAIQTAATGHYSKYSAFNITNNVAIPTASFPQLNYDTAALIPEGFLDQPISLKIGTSSSLNLVIGGGNGGTGYKLDGANVATANNGYTLELVILGVTQQDAYDLASRLSGTGIAGTGVTNTIVGGRVTYSSGANPTGPVYMYVAGR